MVQDAEFRFHMFVRGWAFAGIVTISQHAAEHSELWRQGDSEDPLGEVVLNGGELEKDRRFSEGMEFFRSCPAGNLRQHFA